MRPVHIRSVRPRRRRLRSSGYTGSKIEHVTAKCGAEVPRYEAVREDAGVDARLRVSCAACAKAVRRAS